MFDRKENSAEKAFVKTTTGCRQAIDVEPYNPHAIIAALTKVRQLSGAGGRGIDERLVLITVSGLADYAAFRAEALNKIGSVEHFKEISRQALRQSLRLATPPSPDLGDMNAPKT